MDRAPLHHRILSKDVGLWGVPVRAGLRAIEVGYAAAIALRNAHYDGNGPRAVLPVPVISVGNVTAGGTGKTPLVIELLERLGRMGCNPVVVSRGYKAHDGGANDEERLIRCHVPGAICLSSSNRMEAGEAAIQSHRADVIVLDDAFQHRQLGRTLDIVLVDATCPFGFDHLLPRGLLREPLEALRRADAIVLTRCDQVSPQELARVEARIRSFHDTAKIIKCKHRVTKLQSLGGLPVDEPPDGKRAVLFAGIGRPGAFAETVRGMGVEVVGERWWPDHHAYVSKDWSELVGAHRFPQHDWLMTTEKDAVKLVGLSGTEGAGIVVVRVAIDFEGDGGTMLQSLLESVLRKGWKGLMVHGANLQTG